MGLAVAALCNAGFCGDLMERTKSHKPRCSLCLAQAHLPFRDGLQTEPLPKFHSLLCVNLLILHQKSDKKGNILHFIHCVGAHSSPDMNESSVSTFVRRSGIFSGSSFRICDHLCRK